MRESALLTQNALAKKLNEIKITHSDPVIYPQSVSYWENGRDPSLNALCKLSRMFSVSIEYLLGLTEEQNYDELQFKTNPNLLDLDRIKILMRDYTDDQISVIINSINRYYSAINPSGTEEGGWDDGDVTFAFFLSHLTESVRRLLEFKTYDKNIKSDEREAARDVTKTHMILIVHLLAEIDRIAHGERSITSVLENQKSDEGNNLLLPEEWSVNNMDINTVSPDTDADESLRSKR